MAATAVASARAWATAWMVAGSGRRSHSHTAGVIGESAPQVRNRIVMPNAIHVWVGPPLGGGPNRNPGAQRGEFLRCPRVAVAPLPDGSRRAPGTR
eukprot:3235267-Alexandrium_andersonii.AAC.1